MLLELGWPSTTHAPRLSMLLSYVFLGLVLLQLGCAGVGISWLAIFCQRTQVLWHPFLISSVVQGLMLLNLGWEGVGVSWLALYYPRTQLWLPFVLLHPTFTVPFPIQLGCSARA
jgi:hypothetical protein